MNKNTSIIWGVVGVIIIILIIWILPNNSKVEDKNTSGNIMELQIDVLQEGEGEEIVNGKTAVVHYTGWLTDGKKFDSSVDRGEAFEFPLGEGRVILGWDQGVLGMKVGEKRKLNIPFDLAYGEQGMPPMIPGSADLVFEVELLGIK